MQGAQQVMKTDLQEREKSIKKGKAKHGGVENKENYKE